MDDDKDTISRVAYSCLDTAVEVEFALFTIVLVDAGLTGAKELQAGCTFGVFAVRSVLVSEE